MSTSVLTPAALDQAAVRLVGASGLDAEAERSWAGILAGFDRTAPAAPEARALLSKTVPELIEESAAAQLPGPELDVRLPGRLARALPDWTHRRYRANASHLPSTQLHVAAVILREWGWQAAPHRLRDRRGRRCICGSICAAVALGVGSSLHAEIAAGHVLAELRGQGWRGLIGDWNQQYGRTATEAVQLLAAAHARALRAER